MDAVIQWFSQLGLDFPQLSWLKYVLAGVLLLVFVDLVLSLLLSGISRLFRGK